MIFVDTGYFIALATRHDELHERALRWAATCERLLTTEYVLWETINHFSGIADRPKAHRLLQDIRSSEACEIIAATGTLFERGVEFHKSRPDKAWSLTDCISFCVMADCGLREALAHDDHFEQAGFVALLRREP